MSQFPLSNVPTGELGLLSEAKAEAEPTPQAGQEAPPPVADPGDGLSAVLRDEKQGPAGGMIEKAVAALRECYDPEIPVNIYDLGLIYQVAEYDSGKVYVKMTLTSPMCPVAGSLPPEVKQRVMAIGGVSDARVDVVWDPAWGPEKMSEAARLQLNMF